MHAHNNSSTQGNIGNIDFTIIRKDYYNNHNHKMSFPNTLSDAFETFPLKVGASVTQYNWFLISVSGNVMLKFCHFTTHDQDITILTRTVFLVHECIGLDISTSRSNALVFAG